MKDDDCSNCDKERGMTSMHRIAEKIRTLYR